MPAHGDFAGVLAEQELVQQVLARLPARYRECLLLRTAVGMSNGEIAGTLGISVRNVNTSLFRARERFRQVYAQLAGGGALGTAGSLHVGEEEGIE
jgi:RNA polymerase sigma-70 factor (ECF subfamily)